MPFHSEISSLFWLQATLAFVFNVDCCNLSNLSGTAVGLTLSVQSMLVLAHAGIPIINPIFAITDAIGSLMRKKIESVVTPIVTVLRPFKARYNIPIILQLFPQYFAYIY